MFHLLSLPQIKVSSRERAGSQGGQKEGQDGQVWLEGQDGEEGQLEPGVR